MIKIFIKVSTIIFGNLLAFLSVGYILTRIFQFDSIVYIYLLLLSVVSLVFLLRMEMKSYKGKLEKIITKSTKDNGE